MSTKAKKIRLTRRKLERLAPESIHEARNWSKADVSVVEWPPGSGKRAVVKDLSQRPLWFRLLAGRYFLWREWRALYALKDLKGIPKPIARPTADVIVMEYKAGKKIEDFNSWELPDGAVEKLEELVREMHERGVTHGDLHGHNILVDEEGNVALIDWATASTFGTHPSGPKKFSFEEWRALDERALAKVKIIHNPIDITERQRDLLINGGSRIYRFLKKFKGSFERARGIDEEKLAARAAKKDRYLKRLDRYYSPADEESKEVLKERLRKNKQQKSRGLSTDDA